MSKSKYNITKQWTNRWEWDWDTQMEVRNGTVTGYIVEGPRNALLGVFPTAAKAKHYVRLLELDNKRKKRKKK